MTAGMIYEGCWCEAIGGSVGVKPLVGLLVVMPLVGLLGVICCLSPKDVGMIMTSLT